jgi:hypothetical protein
MAKMKNLEFIFQVRRKLIASDYRNHLQSGRHFTASRLCFLKIQIEIQPFNPFSLAKCARQKRKEAGHYSGLFTTTL